MKERRMKSGRAALGLALCGILAACSGHAAASASGATPSGKYLVCDSLAGICTGVTPKYEPAAILMSGDGSLYAKDVTWSGWGTATATGHGVAEANNCQPDCAEGKLSAHPVTIVLSRPVRWHAGMVYSRAFFSIPSLHDHETSTTGLIPRPAPSVSVPAP
jgi:hypothetical protein